MDQAPGLELTQEIPSLHASQEALSKDALSFDETLKLLDKAVAEQATSQSHRARANFLFGHGKHQEALEDYTQAIEKDPETLKNLYNRAIIHIQLDSYDDAIQDLQQALLLDPEHLNSLIHLAGAYEKLGNYQMALVILEKLASLHPRPEAYNRMASICFRLKHPEEALELFNLAIEMRGDNYLYYNNRGIVYFRLKDYAQALEDFSQAIFYNKDFLSAYKNRANCHAKLMQTPQAIEDYSFVLEKDPENTKILFKRAALYEKSQQFLLAEQDLALLLRIQPDFFEAQEKLSKLKEQTQKTNAQIDTQQNLEQNLDLDPSLDTQLFETKPVNFENPHTSKPPENFQQDIVYTSARGAHLRKDYKTAIGLYDQALESFPKNPEIHYQKAQCLNSLGHVEQAIEAFTTSGKLGLMDGFVSALQNLAHKPNSQARKKISEIFKQASSHQQSSSQKLLLTFFWLYSQKYEIIKPKEYLFLKSEFQTEFIQELINFAYTELHSQIFDNNQEQKYTSLQEALKTLLDVKYLLVMQKVQQAEQDKLDLLDSLGYCYLTLGKPEAALPFLQESQDRDFTKISSLNLLLLAYLSQENFHEILNLTASFWHDFQQKFKSSRDTPLDKEQKNILLCRAIAKLVIIHNPYRILRIFTNQSLQKEFGFAYLDPQDIDFVALFVCKSLFKTEHQQEDETTLPKMNSLEALDEKIAYLKNRFSLKQKLFWLGGVLFAASSLVFTDVFFNQGNILGGFAHQIPHTGLEYISSSSFAFFSALLMIAIKSFLGASSQVQHAQHFRNFINNRLLDNNLQEYLASYLEKLYNNFSLPKPHKKALSKNKIASLKAHIFLDKL